MYKKLVLIAKNRVGATEFEQITSTRRNSSRGNATKNSFYNIRGRMDFDPI